MRRLVVALALLLFLCPLASASTTSAEHAANVAAQQELDSSSPNGNIPSYTLKPADLARAQHLEQVRDLLHFGDAFWGIGQLLLLLATGVVARFQRWSTRLRNRWLQCFAFVSLLTLATWLLSLPVALYAQRLRRAYGLSVQGWPGWFGDEGKSLGLTCLFGSLLVMLMFVLIRRFPARWWLVFWTALVPIGLASIFAMPYVIDPMFNHFEPLAQSHPELVQRLEEVAQRGHMEIPPDRMFLMKASEKTTTLNAYVTGFGASKRVVVWDTSIAKGTPDEILFIFGHESGHYVLHHIVRGTAATSAALLILLYIAYRLTGWCVGRFGTKWGIASQNDWGMLAVLLLVFSVFSVILEPVTSTVSRMQEHAADVYGQEAVHGIVADPQATARAAFQVLGETSYDDPNPSQFIELWTYSHPSIGRRAAFAAHYDPWTAGFQPKYFPTNGAATAAAPARSSSEAIATPERATWR